MGSALRQVGVLNPRPTRAQRCSTTRQGWNGVFMAPSYKSCLWIKNAVRFAVKNGEMDEASQETTSGAPVDKISQTLADLDALLGIEETKEEEEEDKKSEANATDIGVSPSVIQAIAEAEAQRARNAAGGGTDEQDEALTKNVNDSIGRIVEQARKLSESEKDSSAGEQAMRKEFEQLLTVLTGPRGMDKDEIKELKDKVFGTNTFWVTEILPTTEFEQGILVRGNFRGDKTSKFEEICAKVSELYGDKYMLRMIEERDVQLADPDAEPRISIQVIPSEAALPKPAAGWQRGLAAILIGFTLVSSLQLGVTANIGLLPKETLLWLANPDNLNSEILPPGLENFDPMPFLESSVKVGSVALLPQLAHEIGHIIASLILGIKSGPSFLVPNGQLGTFGSITQLKSFAKNRTQLFDFASAGLAAGGVTSLILFIAGLVASHATGGSEAGLVPVPAQLFQGSLVLGGLCKVVLGSEAVSSANVYVSPLLIGGWCGLVATALNALPVGTLDGGRSMLAAYGKTPLAFTSFVTYIGLGLGILGGSLSLPFGLYVLICQRESERNIQDEVSEVDDGRKTMALVTAALAVLILLPGIPDPSQIAIDSGTFL